MLSILDRSRCQKARCEEAVYKVLTSVEHLHVMERRASCPSSTAVARRGAVFTTCITPRAPLRAVSPKHKKFRLNCPVANLYIILMPINVTSRPRVVIVGAGFAGLTAAQRLAKLPVHVTLIDRKNHHTFQPLLYQVATAGLSPGEIATPIRAILAGRPNIEVLLEEVVAFNLDRKQIISRQQTLNYDFLIVASGATHAYFGHEEWAPLAPGLKSIEDALEIRRRVLLAFELAERQENKRRESLPPTAHAPAAPPLQFVVIGAGPTGVELA